MEEYRVAGRWSFVRKNASIITHSLNHPVAFAPPLHENTHKIYQFCGARWRGTNRVLKTCRLRTDVLAASCALRLDSFRCLTPESRSLTCAEWRTFLFTGLLHYVRNDKSASSACIKCVVRRRHTCQKLCHCERSVAIHSICCASAHM